jgi:hypothetical protein
MAELFSRQGPPQGKVLKLYPSGKIKPPAPRVAFLIVPRVNRRMISLEHFSLFYSRILHAWQVRSWCINQ